MKTCRVLFWGAVRAGSSLQGLSEEVQGELLAGAVIRVTAGRVGRNAL